MNPQYILQSQNGQLIHPQFVNNGQQQQYYIQAPIYTQYSEASSAGNGYAALFPVGFPVNNGSLVFYLYNKLTIYITLWTYILPHKMC